MKEFEKLGLSKEIISVIKEKGFDKPSEIQEKTIPLALARKDIIGGSATGSGKTLAFAAPIIQNLEPNEHVQALILTPTRELAEQVADSFKLFSKYKKLNVLSVYGGVDIERQIRKLAETDVLVGTPGRILDHLGRGTLNLTNVKYLVLDEVDRMFDMGFYEDVEQIINEVPKQRQTMLFSATISEDLDYLAQKHTNKPKEVSVNSYVDHSKLKQVYYDVPDYKKFSLLVHLLKKEKSDLAMIFCATRKNSDFIANNLNKCGVQAQAIHGGMSQNKRSNVLEQFQNKGANIIVCTDVAARGLDIKGVSHVYNYDLPPTSKEYIHRIGRTARAGEKGKAISILSSRDYEKFSDITNSEEAENLKIKEEKVPYIQMVKLDFGMLDNKGKGRSRGFSGNQRDGNNRNNNYQRRNSGSGNRREPSRSGDKSGPRNDNRRDNRGPRRDTRGPHNRQNNRRDNQRNNRGPKRDTQGPHQRRR